MAVRELGLSVGWRATFLGGQFFYPVHLPPQFLATCLVILINEDTTPLEGGWLVMGGGDVETQGGTTFQSLRVQMAPSTDTDVHLWLKPMLLILHQCHLFGML